METRREKSSSEDFSEEPHDLLASNAMRPVTFEFRTRTSSSAGTRHECNRYCTVKQGEFRRRPAAPTSCSQGTVTSDPFSGPICSADFYIGLKRTRIAKLVLRALGIMSSAAERLAALKRKLEKARNENLKAVEDEGKRRSASIGNGQLDSDDSADTEEGGSARRQASRKRRLHKRTRAPGAGVDVGSADEADGEDDDDRLRSMKRRAKNLSKASSIAVDGDRPQPQTIAYGVTGQDVKPENIDRMVDELKQVDKRREKFRRRRTFDENRTDITFINEGNRLFNRTLDKHFDKFDSVQKIKDSLERGTA